MEHHKCILFKTNEEFANYSKSNFRSHEHQTLIILDEQKNDTNNEVAKYIHSFYDADKLLTEADNICSEMLKRMVTNKKLINSISVNGIYYPLLYREGLGDMLFATIKKTLIIKKILHVYTPSKIELYENTQNITSKRESEYHKIITQLIKGKKIKYIHNTNLLSFYISKLYIKLVYTMIMAYSYSLFLFNMFYVYLKNEVIKKEINTVDKIIIMPYHGSSILYFDPIINKILSNNNFVIKPITYPWDRTKEIQIGDKKLHITPLNFYKDKDIIQIQTNINKSMKKWRENKSLFFDSSMFILEDINLMEILKDKYNTNLLFWIIKSNYYLHYAKTMIKKEKPSLIIISKNREVLMRCLEYSCNKYNIPSLYIQHGIYIDNWLWDQFNVTKICVDEDFKKILIKRGCDPKKIIVTGPPRYDLLFKKISQNIKHQIIKKKNKQVCFLTSIHPEWSTPENKTSLLKTLISSARNNNFNLVIKLHPNEKTAQINKIINQIDKNATTQYVSVIQHLEVDIFDIIIESDLIVAPKTSGIIPALLSKKPVILLNYYPHVSGFMEGVYNVVYKVAESNTQLTKQLFSFFNHKENTMEMKLLKASDLAKKYAPFADSTKRVMEVIFDTINENKINTV